MSKIFGLDFGTSNSSISLNNNNEISLIEIDPFSTTTTTLKSVLYFDDEKELFLIGQKAVDSYIENGAHGRYIQSIKSFLPSKTSIRTSMGGKNYPIEQLISIIIRKIKNEAEKKIGEEVSDVVLGRPVLFSEDSEIDNKAECLLISAAKIAGFKNIYMQFEPIAAALSYEATLRKGEEKLVLVGDFGGGTSDFSIIKLQGENKTIKYNRQNDILANSGVYIGGNDFDSQIMWERITPYYGRYLKLHNMASKMSGGKATDDFPKTILKQLCKWHSIPMLQTPKILQYLNELKYLTDNKSPIDNIIDLIEDNYGYMLFSEIEKTKCQLSSRDKSEILFRHNNLNINEKLSKEEFEKIISPEISKIKICINSLIEQANIRVSDIDIIF